MPASHAETGGHRIAYTRVVRRLNDTGPAADHRCCSPKRGPTS